MRGITRRLTALLLALSLLTGLLTVTAAAEESAGTGYVKDSLVLQLDANNNTGNGTHDDKATQWVNLADPNKETVDVSGFTWGKDEANGSYYLNLTGGIYLPDAVRQAIGGDAFTIEFLMDGYDGTTAAKHHNIMHLTGDAAWVQDVRTSGSPIKPSADNPNDNFVLFQNPTGGGNAGKFCFRTCYGSGWTKVNDSSMDYCKIDQGKISGATNTLTFRVSGQSHWYTDGTDSGTVATNTNNHIGVDGFKVNKAWQTERKPQVVFGTDSTVFDERVPFSAKVRAIRVYAAELTAEQAARNAAADKAAYHTPYVDPKYTAVPEGYATNGLVLFLDALKNTETGHDNAAAAWTNLADPSESAAFLAGGTNTYEWAANGLFVNGGIILPASVLKAVAGSNFTLEFLVDDYDATVNQTVTRNLLVLIGPDGQITNGANWDDDFVCFQNSTNANPANANQWCFDIKNASHTQFGRVSIAASSVNQVTNALAFDKTKSIIWYQDGAAKSTGTNGKSESWQTGIDLTNGTRLVFGAASGYMKDKAFSGTIKAIRVYDRTLTQEELNANAIADSDRYISAERLAAAAKDSWNAVVTGNASATTAEGLRSFGQSKMTETAKRHLGLTVADGGDGTFTFTYAPIEEGTGFAPVSYTLYVDCDYELDFSKMTEEEAAEFLRNAYAHQGSGGVTPSVVNGTLIYQPNSGARPVSGLYLPVYYSGSNYVWEMDVSFTRVPQNGYTWCGQLFGVKAVDTDQNTCTLNLQSGSAATYEFCKRTQPNQWANHVTTALGSGLVGENGISAEKFNNDYSVNDGARFTLKYVVKDGICFGFIDNVLVVESTNLGRDLSGGFGINSAGPKMEIHRIRVSTDTSKETVTSPIEPYRVDVYEPQTAIAVAPTILQQADSNHADYSQTEGARPASLIYTVKAEDGKLNAYDGETLLGTFRELYQKNFGKVIQGVRVQDQGAADLLAQYVKDSKNANLWVIAEDGKLLSTVSAANAAIRGVVDVTESYPNLSKTALYEAVYGYGYRTILISDRDISEEVMRDLQNMKLVVLVEANGLAEKDLYDLVVAGPNGILTDDSAAAIRMLESFQDYTLVRNSAVVAHRGDRTYPDNSIESITSAAESGAAAVELDVYLTKDGKLLLSHDNDNEEAVDYRNGTWDRVAITNAYWSEDPTGANNFLGKKFYTSGGQEPVEYTTLDLLFDATAEEYPDLTYHIEIKDHDASGSYSRAVDAILALFEKPEYKDLKARCDILCFNTNVNSYAKSKGLAVHNQSNVATTGDLATDLYTYEKFYRNINSLLEPNLSVISTTFLDQIKHYGMTAYPWTANGAELWEFYVKGYHGFTTDRSHVSDSILKAIRAEAAQDGTVKTVAYELKDHGYENPIDAAASDAIKSVEIIPVAGTPTILPDGRTFGGLGDAVAVRCRVDVSQNVGSYGQKFYYLYSESFAPAARAVDKIEVTTPPSVRNYIQNAKGEAVTVDPSGAKILVTYNDGSTETLDVTTAMLSYDGSKVGDQYVTVTYQGKTAAFLINIQPYSAGKHVITVLAGVGGSVTPSGSVYVADQGSLSVTIQADSGYRVLSVAVDGQDKGAIGSYTFETVSGDHTLVASFAKIGGSSGTTPSKPAKPAFTDVPTDSVYKPAIEWAVEKGITAGKTDTTFDPNGGCTRGQAVTFLWRLAGSPEPKSGTMPFTDVDLSSYCGKAVLWAVENGITKGVSETRFQPETAVKRGQAVTFLWRMAGSPAAKGSAMPFMDVAAGSYCGQAVLWAVENGVTTGVSPTRFQPEAAVTRGQIVTFIYRTETL